MLNEPASSLNDEHIQSRRPAIPDHLNTSDHDALYSEIREAVETVLAVESEDFSFSGNSRHGELFLLSRESKLLMTFKGRLLLDSETAYERLDMLFAGHDLLPIFRQDADRQLIYVVQGRVRPMQGGIGLSLILFALTVLSVLYVGTDMAVSDIFSRDPARAEQIAANVWSNLWRGLPYAGSILLILGGHELGHYFMARRHRTAASLPYFLPFPFGYFGTFGAAIRLREPMRNRKVLFDIGAAGPLVGLVFALPILFIGLATSQIATPQQMIPDHLQGQVVFTTEGNSVLYALSKWIVFGRFLPDGQEDVFVNQLAWAGWTGLLVTGLNLIPVGQLDGGHVLYSLIGRRAKRFYLPLILGLLLLTILVANELFVFLALIFLMGNHHAVPLDDITPLDSRRRSLAIFTLVVFLLVFVPQPFTQSVVNINRSPDGFFLSLGLLLVWSGRAGFRRSLPTAG